VKIKIFVADYKKCVAAAHIRRENEYLVFGNVDYNSIYIVVFQKPKEYWISNKTNVDRFKKIYDCVNTNENTINR